MKIKESDLVWAVEQKILNAAQATSLWGALQNRYRDQPGFALGHLIYYLGALIIISSMTWFMVTGWERMGGSGILVVSLIYAASFVWTGFSLWQKPPYKIPGGLLMTTAVWMTPLSVYGFQKMLGWWPTGNPSAYVNYHHTVKGCWVFMELATILVGLLALRWVRFGFLTFPVAFSLWFLSMDLVPLAFGKMDLSRVEQKWVSIVFGIVMLFATYWVDRKTRESEVDFVFWGYLFGLLAFWGGLSTMESVSELDKFVYFLINFMLIFLSIFLGRRAFAVFGAMGVFGYLSHLANSIFKDELLFPFVMSMIGIGIVYLGVVYQRHQKLIDARVLALIPDSLRKLRPRVR